MKIILLGLLTLIIISCGEKPDSQFSLKGITNGIKNGTILYIDSENTTIDSTVVENNVFIFESKLSSSPQQVILRKKDFSQYRYMWVENKSMTFDATKTDFRNAVVVGSESENLSFNLSQKVDTLSIEERQKSEMEFVKINPASIVSASMLSLYSTTWGKEKTQELYENFSEGNKSSKFGKEISRYIELNKDPKIGEQFIDFEMRDQYGTRKTLSSLKGKVTLLEFWASWCGPCRQENPNLVKTYEKFYPKGFEIVAVSLDEDNDSWLSAIKTDNLNWVHLSDLKGRRNDASLIYGINGIPDNFLFAENGKIIGRNLRGDKLAQKLQEILK